jgi:hypothetical protein
MIAVTTDESASWILDGNYTPKLLLKDWIELLKHYYTKKKDGFRRDQSCRDSIFTIAQLLENHRGFNIPKYMAFIDYHKAFHKVSRLRMCNIPHTKGIPQHLITAI